MSGREAGAAEGALAASLGIPIRVTPARRLAFFVGMDLMLVLASVVAAVFLRFEGDPPAGSAPLYFANAALLGGLVVATSFVLGAYRASWSFIGLRDIARLATAVALATAATLGIILSLRGAGIAPTPSLAVSLMQAPISFWALAGFRMLKRAARLVLHGRSTPEGSEPALIVGAGTSGAQVLESIQESPGNPLRVVGLLDDDPLAWNTSIHGVRVLGPVSELERRLLETGARTVIIAISNAKSALVRDVVLSARRLGVHKVRIVPTPAELVGSPSLAKTRAVTMDDLLGRDPVQIDMGGVRAAIAGKCVLVTGGAGTIGSELCRQVARFQPREIVILDIDETRIHDLALELGESAPDVLVAQALADVRDDAVLDEVFRRHAIDVVFHAAAYKHVPMMELWPLAALDVNVLGTLRTLEAAQRHGVERFVLISTDKAVEPSSVMGASKRLAELALFGSRPEGIRLAAVRFGNVLGSRGSVLPIFERQLAAGGPLTVTHPEIERYFMMTSEAVQLVLQSSILASSRDVFVLDMGKPVRIVDVAREFIRLHGLEPDKDIGIVFTGLRPGEKLTESLHYSDESLASTDHPRIFKATVRVAPASATIRDSVAALVERRDHQEARAYLERTFPSLAPELRPKVKV